MAYKKWLCRTYLPKVDCHTVVCDSIGKQYEQDTGVPYTVMTNATRFYDLEPVLSPDEEGPIRLVHHGYANPSRHIEDMINLMKDLDERFTLTLYLKVHNSLSYDQYLRRLAHHEPRIVFKEIVPMQELPDHLNSYDMGLYLLRPVNFNQEHALPNKLFEFIQARLAVAIGPSIKMKAIVEKSRIGIVSPDFSIESLATLLCLMTKEDLSGKSFRNSSYPIRRVYRIVACLPIPSHLRTGPKGLVDHADA